MIQFPFGMKSIERSKILLENIDIGKHKGLAVSRHDTHQLRLVFNRFHDIGSLRSVS